MADLSTTDLKLLRRASKKAQIDRIAPEPSDDKLHWLGKAPVRVEPQPRQDMTDQEIEQAKAKSAAKAKAARDQERKDRIYERLFALQRDTGAGRLDPVRHTTLANYQALNDEMRDCVDMIQEYLDGLKTNIEEGNGIILFGAQGTGKDHLCLAVARQAIIEERATSARWVYGPVLREMALDAVRGGSRDKIDRYKSAGVLVLSDPVQPNEATKEYYHDVLAAILNERNAHRRPTFITSNCLHLEAKHHKTQKLIDIESLLGTQLYSRVQEGAFVFKCTWGDWRKRGKK